MDTKKLPADCTVLAPDGSEIRELVAVKGASMVHCTLPIGTASMAVVHRTVEEVWYFIQGQGQVWRKCEAAESVVEVEPGSPSLSKMGRTSNSSTLATRTCAL